MGGTNAGWDVDRPGVNVAHLDPWEGDDVGVGRDTMEEDDDDDVQQA